MYPLWQPQDISRNSRDASRSKDSKRITIDHLAEKFGRLSIKEASGQCKDELSGFSTTRLKTSRTYQKTLHQHNVYHQTALSRVPPELLQMIYRYLGPHDFDAARHTCRTWMLASRHILLLKEMLQRGGWWTGVVEELGPKCRNAQSLNLCYLSDRLARECSLSAGWREGHLEYLNQHSPQNKSQIPIKQTYFTDITELSSFDSGPAHQHECGLLLTPSICAGFLAIADGCSIYVYQLLGLHLRPLTIIVCPRRVLSMSMDTSSNRYSVAALLDGRMGCLCSLDIDPKIRKFDNSESPDISSQNAHSRNNLCMTASVHPLLGRIGVQSFRISAALQEQYLDSGHESSYQYTREGSQSTHRAWFDYSLPAKGLDEGIPISRVPLSVYHSVCSPEDPPRSIAVCPNRQCLAFGCDAGVELHWKDLLSGKHLMKWFSLTTPTDFLYFFPRQRKVDDVDRLRLISSQAGPGQQRKEPSFQLKNALGIGEMPCSRRVDHYAAMPLSDGHDVLFTDPSTGNLIIGSDKQRSLESLSHRITLIPPRHVHVSKLCPPSVYACAADLSWGARIVAAYGEELVFFSIPPDVLTFWRCQGRLPKVSVRGEMLCDDDFTKWHEWSLLQNAAVDLGDGSQPIHGTWLGNAPGVSSLAVQSTLDPVVWAFCRNGTAHTWQVGGKCRNVQVVERAIDRNGGVLDLVDRDGDRIMPDAAPLLTSEPKRAPIKVDADGDVQMTGMPTTSNDCAMGVWGIEYIPSMS